MALGTAGSVEILNEISIGIKHAYRRNIPHWKPFLPSCLTQQVLWRKDRGGIIVFVGQNGYISKAISVRNHAFCFPFLSSALISFRR